jgi:cytosine/adenosine deaminase-related metal-dependent hydrolase
VSDEYRISVDRTWPTLEETGEVGIKNGTIVPVERLESPEEMDFRGENSVLTPGWINAHAHLELSGATDIEFNGDFVDWIYDVLDFKLSLEKEQIQSAFANGCNQLLASGVCRVFDHCDRTDWLLDEALDADLDVRLLKELIAFLPEQMEEVLREADDFLERLNDRGLRGGLAPHAPYSAHPDLYKKARERLSNGDGVFSTHLHESPEEMEFVTESSGRFQDLLEERTGSRHDSPYHDRPLAEMAESGVFDCPGLAVHLNYLTEDDLRWLESSRCYPVFCPRSYDYFGYETMPVEEWHRREIAFCLGTDSRASNQGLDMLSELRTLNDLTDELSTDRVLEALTVNPARVMGEPERGELTYGTPADLSLFETDTGDADELVRGEAETLAVFVDGQCRYRRG